MNKKDFYFDEVQDLIHKMHKQKDIYQTIIGILLGILGSILINYLFYIV